MSIKNILVIMVCFWLVLPAGLVSAIGEEDAGKEKARSMPGVGEILDVIGKATTPEETGDQKPEWSGPIKLVIVFTALAIIPSLLIMMTSFTRIIIVLSFARRALGTQTIPPTTAIIGLAMFLTLFTMAPTFSEINEKAIGPYLADEVDFNAALAVTGESIKGFMLKQVLRRPADLNLFVQMSRIEKPESPEMVPLYVTIPAFIISEFRTAFEMGCLLFIPFLLIDLVTASILLSAGMMMLPPVMVSLPFKLILFILVDGWSLLAKSLSLSFG
ncbi:MAG: flagellar type III secretion system pore protein FliP [Planctomycetes bacterium]|nr:flagellar type III secretion system pore protein FliP [Planctomycetota bacterium]